MRFSLARHSLSFLVHVICLTTPNFLWGQVPICWVEQHLIPTEFSPISLSVNDFDGDGLPDYLVVQFQSEDSTNSNPTMTLFSNRGDGTFEKSSELMLETIPLELLTSDLDNDGDLDCVIRGAFSEPTSIFLNSGVGTFRFTQFIAPLPVSPEIVAIGDLNSDGFVDLASTFDGVVEFHENDGTGFFNFSTSIPINQETESIELADLDSDRDLDLIVSTVNTTKLFQNDDGKFSAIKELPLGAERIRSGDLDADGDLDVVLFTETDATILINDGSGNLGIGDSLFTGLSGFRFKLNDIDSDGDLDILTLNLGNTGLLTNVSTLFVRENNGSGQFALAETYLTGLASADVDAGDVDGDGDQDLIIANFFGKDVTLLLNDQNQNFGKQLEVLGVPTLVCKEDFNLDGFVDLAFSNSTGFAVNVFLNDQLGAFEQLNLLPNGEANETIATGDINGDGFPDIVHGQQLLINQNGLGFVEERRLGFLNEQFHICDFDGNEFLDFITFIEADNRWGVFISSDGVEFSEQTQPENIVGFRVLCEDFDSDGDVDIFTFSPATDVRIYFNNGNGSFEPGISQEISNPSIAFAADLDSDGDIDVLLRRSNGLLYSLLNDGNGQFSSRLANFSISVTSPGSAWVQELSDVNKDGIPDVNVILTDSVMYYSALLIGVGDGTFHEQFQSTEVNNLSSALVVDLENDGNLEMLGLHVDTFGVGSFLSCNSIQCSKLGDVNLDGVVNLLDVEPFIEILVEGIYQVEADTNFDNQVNLLDVTDFVELLTQ